MPTPFAECVRRLDDPSVLDVTESFYEWGSLHANSYCVGDDLYPDTVSANILSQADEICENCWDEVELVNTAAQELIETMGEISSAETSLVRLRRSPLSVQAVEASSVLSGLTKVPHPAASSWQQAVERDARTVRDSALAVLRKPANQEVVLSYSLQEPQGTWKDLFGRHQVPYDSRTLLERAFAGDLATSLTSLLLEGRTLSLPDTPYRPMREGENFKEYVDDVRSHHVRSEVDETLAPITLGKIQFLTVVELTSFSISTDVANLLAPHLLKSVRGEHLMLAPREVIDLLDRGRGWRKLLTPVSIETNPSVVEAVRDLWNPDDMLFGDLVRLREAAELTCGVEPQQRSAPSCAC